MFFPMAYFLYWDYWNLYHKVTFDGRNRLILVNDGITQLDWKEDVYSAWKEWMLLDTLKENAAFLPAMRAVGGDTINEASGRFLGSTFFLQNGWRLRTWNGDHRLTITGNVFTEEGDSIDVPTTGDNNTVIELQVSNLIDLIEVSGSVEASTLAAAVRNELALELGRVDTTISSRASQGSVDNSFTTVIDLQGILSDKIDVVSTQVQEIDVDITEMLSILAELKKAQFNRTKIDVNNKTLTIYQDDDITPAYVFNLRDTAGTLSTTEVVEREPQ